MTYGPQPPTRRARHREFRLRPLNVMEILDEALALYRANAKLFLAVIWFPALLIALSQAALSLTAGWMVMPDEDPGAMMGVVGAFVLAALGFAIIAVLGWAYQQAALTTAVAARYLDRPIAAAEVHRDVRSRIFSLLGAYLLAYLIMGLSGGLFFGVGLAIMTLGLTGEDVWGLFGCCLICPGSLLMLVLGVLFALISPSVMVDKLGAVDAIARSARLAWSSFFRVAGLILLVGIISFIFTMIVRMALVVPLSVFGLMDLTFAEPTTVTTRDLVVATVVDTIQSLASVIVMPFSATATVLLYFDIRIRKEGFDVEMLARAMGGSSSPEFML